MAADDGQVWLFFAPTGTPVHGNPDKDWLTFPLRAQAKQHFEAHKQDDDCAIILNVKPEVGLILYKKNVIARYDPRKGWF